MLYTFLNTQIKKSVMVIVSMLLFLLVGTVAEAKTASFSLSGTSYTNCDYGNFSVLNGPNTSRGLAQVTSGVEGVSATYDVSNNTGQRAVTNINKYTYTLAPSVSNPLYERTRLEGWGNVIYGGECDPGFNVGDWQAYEGDMHVHGDVRSVTFGSYAWAHVYLQNIPVFVDGYVDDYTQSELIHLESHVKGAKTTSVTPSGDSEGGQTNNSVLNNNGTSDVTYNTAYARSYVVDGSGNYIAGPFDASGETCGADITYPVGANVTGVARQQIILDGEQTNTVLGQNLAARLVGRRVVYYSAPQFLINQGVCSATTVDWTSQTVYTCALGTSAPAADIDAIVAANPGSRVETYYATEAIPPAYPFPSEAVMFPGGDTPNSNEEGFMYDYAGHVPLSANQCTESTQATPQLSCVLDVTYADAITDVEATWEATVLNASGQVTYEWTGTDGLTRTITRPENIDRLVKTYSTAGIKNADVIVRSGGQETVCTQNFEAYTQITGSCYASPSRITTGGSITWNSDISGGVGPYTYSWTGTDGLSGSNATAAKVYNSTGVKNATLTVTDDLGQQATIVCSGEVQSVAPTTYQLQAQTFGQCRINSSDNKIACGADCSEEYNSGAQVTLYAVSSPESAFVKWGGVCSGATGTTCNVIMSADRYASAQCALLPEDGFTITSANQCQVGAGSIALGWTESKFATHYQLLRSENGGTPRLIGDVTTIPYRGGNLTVSFDSSVRSFVDTGLNPGSTYTYQLIAVNEYGVSSPATTVNTPAVACTLNCSISATNSNTKAPTVSSVSIDSVTGTAIGNINYGISCGGGTLSVNPNDPSKASCSFTTAGSYTVTGTVNRGGQNTTCTAPVTVLESNKFLNVAPVNCRVTSFPSGITCGGGGTDCAEGYAHNTSVRLTATPDAGYVIAGWNGACAGSSSTCDVTMNANKNVGVTCLPNSIIEPCTLDLEVRDSGGTYRDGAVVRNFGDSAELRWVADKTADGTAISSSNPSLVGWNGTETAPNGVVRSKIVTNTTPTSKNHSFVLSGVNTDGQACTDNVAIHYKPRQATTPGVVPTCAPDGISKMQLTWSKTGDLADKVTVLGGPVGSEVVLGNAICSGDSCRFTHTNLTEGGLYTYRLRNENEYGLAPLSASRSAVAATCSVSYPDLTVTNLVEVPLGTHYVGDQIRLAGIIKNIGEADAIGTWEDQFFVKAPYSGSPGSFGLSKLTHTNLGAGQTYAVTTNENITLDVVGDWDIYLHTDAGNVIKESDETNNFLIKTIPVVPALGPVPPVACTFTPEPAVTSSGAMVAWNATSTGGDGVYSYVWKYDDGTYWTSEANSSDATPTRYDIYNTEGTYRPTLTVTSASTSAICSGTVVVNSGEELACSISNVNSGGTTSYQVDVFNGTEHYEITHSGGFSGSPTTDTIIGTGQNKSVNYASEGLDTINVSVRDVNTNEIATCDTTVDVPPVAARIEIRCQDYYHPPQFLAPRSLGPSEVYATTSSISGQPFTYTQEDYYLILDSIVSEYDLNGDYIIRNFDYTYSYDVGWMGHTSLTMTGRTESLINLVYQPSFPPITTFDMDELPLVVSPLVRVTNEDGLTSAWATCPPVTILCEDCDGGSTPFDYTYTVSDVVVKQGEFVDKTITVSKLQGVAEPVTLSTPDLPTGLGTLFSGNNPTCTPDPSCNLAVRYTADADAPAVEDFFAVIRGTAPSVPVAKTRPYFITITEPTVVPDVDLYITDKTRSVTGGVEKIRRGKNAVLKWVLSDLNLICDLTSDERGNLGTDLLVRSMIYPNVQQYDRVQISCDDGLGGPADTDYLFIEPIEGPPDLEEF